MKNNSFLKSYKNLRVLITGSTGFKGAWLSFWLNEIGAKVIGVALKPEKNSVLFKSLKVDEKIQQYYLDITNFNKLNEIIKKKRPDIIFHLAAQSIVSNSFKDPLNNFKTNILGSANVLESFRINKIPNLVYITSDKCYLNLDKKKNYKETDILGGIDNYSSSKASAEIIFSSYFNSYFIKEKNLSLVSARAGNVVGGGDMKDNRIVPDIIKSLINKKRLILRNPKATRPWQHVLEPLSGYLMLVQNIHEKKIKKMKQNWNFAPNISSCKSVLYLSKYLSKYLKLDIIINKNQSKKIFKPETSILRLSNYKSRKFLNWHPKWPINKSLDKIIEWNQKIKITKVSDICYQQIAEYLKN